MMRELPGLAADALKRGRRCSKQGGQVHIRLVLPCGRRLAAPSPGSGLWEPWGDRYFCCFGRGAPRCLGNVKALCASACLGVPRT